jgi:surface antigen
MKGFIRTFEENLIRHSITLVGRRPAYHKLTRTHKKSSLRKSFRRLFRKSQKRLLRYGVLATNLTLLAIVGLVVAGNATHTAGSGGSKAQLLAAPAAQDEANPLDQLSSADIAVNVARLARMDEAAAVTENADSVNTQLAVSSTDDNLVVKPQIVSTALKSNKDIKKYIVVEGDTISSIAAEFGVTSDTIRNSNGLSGDTVRVGTELLISPVNGMVYTVKAGDTPDSIAKKYQVSTEQLIAFNDAELTGTFPPGELIVIPDAVQPVTATSTAHYTGYANYSTSGYSAGRGALVVGDGNGYAPGWCTWYAAERAGVPSGWGNANRWDDNAPSSGWTVSRTPVVGAVAQSDRMSFAGHVAIVEAVSEDGTQMKYSDMNGIAGFGRVGYSDWVPVSMFEHYIYH